MSTSHLWRHVPVPELGVKFLVAVKLHSWVMRQFEAPLAVVRDPDAPDDVGVVREDCGRIQEGC